MYRLILVLALTGILIGCERASAPEGSRKAASPRRAISRGAIASTESSPLSAQVILRLGASSGLREPRGIAVDREGNLYVADAGNGRVVKFDASGQEVGSFGRKGTGPGEFSEPWIPALSPEGNVLVLDRESTWILMFAPDGRFINRIAGPEKRMYFPGGMAIAPDGTIVIADTGLDRLIKLRPDGSLQGNPVTTVAGEPLKQPTDVSIDSLGALHVYQTAGLDNPSLLFHIPPTGSESKWITVEAPSTRDSPRSVVAPDGRIFLTDPAKGQVLVYTADGKTFRPLKVEGPQAASFKALAGITMDSEGRLFVVDAGTNVVYGMQLTTTS